VTDLEQQNTFTCDKQLEHIQTAPAALLFSLQ